MKRLLFQSALAAAATASAPSPAAQYFPAPPNWGFGYERFAEVRFLTARVDRIQEQIRRMDHRHQITGRSGARLIEEANAIQRKLRNDAAFGLTPAQAEIMARRIIRLERQVGESFAERDRRHQDPYLYGNSDWRRDADQDRDHNGRDDRWEDEWRVDSPTGPPR